MSISNVSINKLSDGETVGYFASNAYFVCDTAADVKDKIATSPDSVIFSNTSLVRGVTVQVKFAHTNTYTLPTLQIGTSDAKLVMRISSMTPVGPTPVQSWPDNSIVSFTYDGTYWVMNNYKPAIGGITINGTTVYPDANGNVDLTSLIQSLIT